LAWFAYIQLWLSERFKPGERLYIAIDRTSWGTVNLLVVSVIWKKRAIPLYWELLDKLGSTNWEEQPNAIAQILPLLKGYSPVILGDREFCSVRFAQWLSKQGCGFCLRLKCSTNVAQAEQAWSELASLGLTPGTSLFLNSVKVTKQKGFGPFQVASKWKRRYRGFGATEPWFILTNLGSLDEAIQAYQRRFGIEEMFRDFKKGGYSLERCKLTHDRLVSMLILVAIAYVESWRSGQSSKDRGIQKYLARPEMPGQPQRRHSAFQVGLCAYRLSPLFQLCEPLIRALLRLNPNKKLHYQKGLRALELAIPAF